jgi:hypothetical protein
MCPMCPMSSYVNYVFKKNYVFLQAFHKSRICGL